MSSSTITIKPEVALAEEQAANAALKNRNLILAQTVHDLRRQVQELEAAAAAKGTKK